MVWRLDATIVHIEGTSGVKGSIDRGENLAREIFCLLIMVEGIWRIDKSLP